MSIYNVYLADLSKDGEWFIDHDDVIREILYGWFFEILRATSWQSFSGLKVSWVDDPPPIMPEELLVYFVKDPSHSIVTASDLSKDTEERRHP
jgi:hypothetical protein